tara:strand:+ start:367 stop:528 length:162 start_codon:yes stop_codon:yes gene_type:complete
MGVTKLEATATLIEAVVFALPREKEAYSKHVAATAKQNASHCHSFMVIELMSY